MASSLFQGASIGPLIDLAVEIDPRYDYCIWNLILLLDILVF